MHWESEYTRSFFGPLTADIMRCASRAHRTVCTSRVVEEVPSNLRSSRWLNSSRRTSIGGMTSANEADTARYAPMPIRRTGSRLTSMKRALLSSLTFTGNRDLRMLRIAFRSFFIRYDSSILDARVSGFKCIGIPMASDSPLRLFPVSLDHIGKHRGQVKSAAFASLDHAVHLEVSIGCRKYIDRAYHKQGNVRFPVICHMNHHARNSRKSLRDEACANIILFFQFHLGSIIMSVHVSTP